MNLFRRKPQWTSVVPAGTQQTVNQAVEQLAHVAMAYSLPLLTTQAEREAWQHDLGLELANNNLKSLQLELIDGSGRVIFRYQLGFTNTGGKHELQDLAQGIELPVINLSRSTSHRLTYSYHKWTTANVPYNHLFRINWSPAKQLDMRIADKVNTQHAGKVSGGKLAGTIELDGAERRELVVTNSVNQRFAFAKEVDGELEGIYLHPDFAQPGIEFRIGQRLTAQVIQTPRGLQGREVRAA